MSSLPDLTSPAYRGAAREVRACVVCQGSFLIHPRAIRVTCSRACSSTHRSRVHSFLPKVITCEWCLREAPRTVHHGRQRYCSNPCRLAALNALPRRVTPMDQRARLVTPKGYIRISLPSGRLIMEHRWVMQEVIGRPLTRVERVHHLNGDRADNRAENLVLCASQAEHMRLWHPDLVHNLPDR